MDGIPSPAGLTVRHMPCRPGGGYPSYQETPDVRSAAENILREGLSRYSISTSSEVLG